MQGYAGGLWWIVDCRTTHNPVFMVDYGHCRDRISQHWNNPAKTTSFYGLHRAF
jgi:hypothetical protein